MKINWGRILNAGLVLEILLIGLYQIFAALHGNGGLANYVFVVVGSFVFMLVGALWVGRKIESGFVVHGLLVGVVAVIYYVIRSLPDALSGKYQDYVLWFIVGHTPKLLGGIAGGFLAGRRKRQGFLRNSSGYGRQNCDAKRGGVVTHPPQISSRPVSPPNNAVP